MVAAKSKTKLKPGDVLYANIGDEHIRDSDPCNKDNCMVTRGFTEFLVTTYGGKASDYKVKSTNHGASFELNGRKYVSVFDTKTASRIYKYDQTFRDTRSKEKARAGVRKFTTRIMIEASTTATKWPAMTPEVKARLNSLPRKQKVGHTPRPSSSRREISM